MSYVAHQYSRVDFYSSLEVNLSLYYGGVLGMLLLTSDTNVEARDRLHCRFEITVLVRFVSVWFWLLVTALLIVWSQNLLLCPLHQKLRI